MQQRDIQIMRQRHSDGRGRPLHRRNGPLRGNARQKYESYLARAREAQWPAMRWNGKFLPARPSIIGA